MNLTIEIPDDEVRALEARAQEQGISPEQYAQQLLVQDLKPRARKHISEVIRDNMRDTPRDVLEALPRDASSQHDHYIYGSPKKQQ